MKFIGTIVLCGFLCLLGFIHGQSNPSDSVEEVRCSGLWVQIHRGCYMFVAEEESWNTALEHCKSHGGQLTSIQSWKEKEELQIHLAKFEADTTKWWVGLKRNESTTGLWKWIDNDPLDSNVLPWKDPRMKDRDGELCGHVEMVTAKLQIVVTGCSRSMPFICEYHSIQPRSETVAEATTIPTTTESTTVEPTDAPPQTTDRCLCRDTIDVLSSDSDDDSSENRLKRRNQALNVDEELYQRYLQSEIDANNAKVVYYSEVAKFYQEALEAQNKYYASYKQKLDLEVTQLQQGTKCT